MSFTSDIDEALKDMVSDIEIDSARLNRMKSAYNHLIDVLNDDESFFSQFEKRIEAYPQGSVSLGTTIKPSHGDEFDLDLVIQIHTDYKNFTSEQLYEELYRVLYAEFKNDAEKMNRCVRINYKNDFHMDVLPGIDEHLNSKSIVVPDKKKKVWVPSNPKGYTEWFIGKANRMSFSEEELFSQHNLDVKEFEEHQPLKQAVKLLKMYRDEYFSSDLKNKTPSIIITTLAGTAYNGSTSLYQIVKDFIMEAKRVYSSATPAKLPNPSYPKENLAERFHDAALYDDFKHFISNLETKWDELKQDADEKRRENVLREVFSNASYEYGLEHFNERMRQKHESDNDFSGLLEATKSQTPFQRPYVRK